MTMDNVIYSYTDEQALADGVLFPIDYRGTNRVTSAVWHDHNEETLRLIIDECLLQPLTDDIVHNLDTDEGKTFWLMHNEHGKMTLMYPDDY